MICDSVKETFSGVSVVVNTCDRARYLSDCLQSLSRQSVKIQVIVVNGPSSDDTEIVCAKYPEIIYRTCKEKNLSKSRNIGISAASGHVVAFIDDDAVAHEDWAKNILSAYTDERVAGAGGFTLDNTGRSFQSMHLVSDWRADSWSFANEPAAGLLTDSTRHYASLLGANSSFRRSDLLRIGGFDETYAYFLDETDVCARLAQIGKIIKTVASALVLHRYAPSHIRNERRLSTSLYATIRSKVYFCYKFSRRNEREIVDEYVKKFLNDQYFSLNWHVHRAKYTATDFFRLQDEIYEGADAGRAIAITRSVPKDSLSDWLAVEREGESQVNQFLGRSIEGRIRIAFVSQGYPPGDTNGIARWTKSIAESAVKSGHVVHVITRSTNGQMSTEYLNGVWVHSYVCEDINAFTVPPVRLPDSLLSHGLCVRREVLRIQGLWGLDVVSGPIWDVEAIMCGGIPGIFLVTTLHTTYALMRPFKAEWRFNPHYDQNHVQLVIEAERWLMENSDLVVANSQSVVAEILACYPGIRLSNHVVVPHGFDLPKKVFTPADDEPIRVVFIGRMEKRKGIDLLLRAALETDIAFDLQIIGSKPENPNEYSVEVERQITLLHEKDKLRVLEGGFVSDDQLEEIYSNASIIVVPSRYESFGLVVIEAMGRAVPVIVADVGGMSEIVSHGVNGLKFISDDSSSLREVLENLIKDKNLRRQLATNARISFEKLYTADRMVRSFFSHLLTAKDAAYVDH